MTIKGIRYTAPLLDNSGYARAARGNVLALHKAGIPLTLNPISFESIHPDLGKDDEVINSLIDKQIEYDYNIIHSTPEFWSRYLEPGVKNVGYTIWETTKLHPDWPKYINNSVDKVLVGCEWNKQVFEDSGVTIPIGVVPHGISKNEYNGVDKYDIAGIKDSDFMFYNISQFTERKNLPALIKAYYYAFSGVEDVVLVLKTYRNDYSDAEKKVIRDILKQLKMGMPMEHHPKIILIPNMLTEAEIAAIHQRGDCYVSLDRAEGFGLCPFQAGAAGNPIIVTGFGGSTEYAKEDNSYLVNYQLTPVSGMWWSPWYRGDQCWAQPDVIHGAKFMKQVYTDREVAVNKGKKLQSFIYENFSWECIAEKFIKEIEDIDGYANNNRKNFNNVC
jgi:glycosyltransferase involved in cell wall biosynthesis